MTAASGTEGRGPQVLSRRAAWLVAAGVVVLGAVFVVVQYATGHGAAQSVRSGMLLVVVVGCGLTVNQVAARRRLRRAQEVERRSTATRQAAAQQAAAWRAASLPSVRQPAEDDPGSLP
jgi:uncharacterized membrane protein YidH (DUF202 family)